MTEQDLTVLNKMQALMDAASTQAESLEAVNPRSIQSYRYQCFAMIDPHFWALADQLSFKRNYDSGATLEGRMTAFMLAHDPVTSKWYTDTLEQLGLQEHAPSTEDNNHG